MNYHKLLISWLLVNFYHFLQHLQNKFFRQKLFIDFKYTWRNKFPMKFYAKIFRSICVINRLPTVWKWQKLLKYNITHNLCDTNTFNDFNKLDSFSINLLCFRKKNTLENVSSAIFDMVHFYCVYKLIIIVVNMLTILFIVIFCLNEWEIMLIKIFWVYRMSYIYLLVSIALQ